MNAVALKLLNKTLPVTSMSEDCLYLSVYTPAYAREGSSLPVSARPHRLRCGSTFLLQED